jgi:superfamily II DNA or RNA helicase
MITIRVAENAVHVSGLDPIQLNDLYADAPEPAPKGFGGLRPVAANLLYLLEKFPDAVLDDDTGKMMEARAVRFLERIERTPPGEYEAKWPFKLKPDEWQLKLFAAARTMKYFAMAPVATGAGKSKAVIDIAADKFMRGEIDCVAVVCSPSAMRRQWIREAFPTHMTDAVKWLGDWFDSTREPDRDVMRSCGRRFLRVLTFNVEAFSREGGKASLALMEFMSSGRCLLVWDESSKGKSPTATRTKVLTGYYKKGKWIEGLAQRATCRVIMTATPITRGMEDLFTQYDFLSRDIIGLTNWYAQRARYCVTVPAFRGAGPGVVKIKQYRNVEEFIRKIAPYTFAVPKSVLGLAEPVFEELPVELTREQEKLYSELRKKLAKELKEGGWANPLNAAVRVLRLQQLLCGRVYALGETVEEPARLVRVPSLRIKTMLDYMEDHPGPTIIWCRFSDDIREIVDALQEAKHRPVAYYGDVPEKERDRNLKEFLDGRADDFVANPSCAGMGLDGLQYVNPLSIWYSTSFNREHRWQGVGRVHRRGLEGAAVNVDLVAQVKGSVDRLVLDSLADTEDLVQSLNTTLRRLVDMELEGSNEVH